MWTLGKTFQYRYNHSVIQSRKIKFRICHNMGENIQKINTQLLKFHEPSVSSFSALCQKQNIKFYYLKECSKTAAVVFLSLFMRVHVHACERRRSQRRKKRGATTSTGSGSHRHPQYSSLCLCLVCFRLTRLGI